MLGGLPLRGLFTLLPFLLAGGGLLLGGCSNLPNIIPDSRQKARGNVELYRRELERRLLDKYNNLPDWAGKVGRVEVIVGKNIEHSIDGKKQRVEFDQLVYDQWGKRITKLEKDYFIVVFGDKIPKVVQLDPSINVGLDAQAGFSESYPLEYSPDARSREHRRAVKNEGNTLDEKKKESTLPSHHNSNSPTPMISAEPDELIPVRLGMRKKFRNARQPQALQGMVAPQGWSEHPPRAQMRFPERPLPEPELNR